jgi:hypothetical protein
MYEKISMVSESTTWWKRAALGSELAIRVVFLLKSLSGPEVSAKESEAFANASGPAG